MKNNQISQYQCKTYERDGQLAFALNTEVMLPETAEVRFIDAELDKLDYSELYSGMCRKGRKYAVDPKTMFKVVAYAYEKGIYSSRKIEEACRMRIDFIWMLGEEKAPDHSTIARFRKERSEEIEALFYQYVRKLEEEGETDHEVVYVDGTKVESRAGRYTFVWRKSVEKNLEKVKIELLEKTGTKTVTEARAKVAEKVSGLIFVHGTGKRKSLEQKEAERLLELLERMDKYEEQLGIMGNERNSYSKTDHGATFMRMKEDHMKNGQLKPGYNLQFAVNSEYITGLELFSDRTDSRTLIPLLEEMKKQHGGKVYEKVSADAGYESNDNYLYLEENGQSSFIKPVNFEAKKTTKYKSQIGRIENMTYLEEEDCYVCAEGRKLKKNREVQESHGRFPRTQVYYRCEDCSGCSQRSRCSKAKDPLDPKEVRCIKGFDARRKQSEENLQSIEGIRIRVSRSIQVEGAFGLMKEDYAFRRFLSFGAVNVRTEMFLFGIGFNLKKRYYKTSAGRQKTHFNYDNTA